MKTTPPYRSQNARNLAFAVFGIVVVAVIARGQGGAPDYPPFELKAADHVTEQGFCEDYLDWIAFRASVQTLDSNYAKRLEEARFALRQHLAYLEEQPFLAKVADDYRAYLKDLDSVQGRIERWRALGGADSAPDYAEAVAGFVRETVYDEGEAISPDILETNYFAQRMRADERLPVAQNARDRNGILESYDLYVAAASAVPSGKPYDAFRIDVLRKAVASGRQVFVLGGDKPERGFAQSVNPDDAREFVRLCVSLRALSPADSEGEIKAAAAIGKWGAGDLKGAFDEALPVVELRRTDGGFALFCSRLASAAGRTDKAMEWLEQAVRCDALDFPSAALLRLNPDFAAVREQEAVAFGILVSRLEALENLDRAAEAARILAGGSDSLEVCKELHDRLPGIESSSLQAHILAATILGLRLNGKEAAIGDMEAKFEEIGSSETLHARLGKDALMDSCGTCNGTGVDLAQNRRCAKCGGSGVCAFEYCRKGLRFSPFDRNYRERPKCGDCRGTGICRYCKGRGKLPCPACHGSARAFSKARIEVSLRAVAADTLALAESERAAYLERIRRLPVR